MKDFAKRLAILCAVNAAVFLCGRYFGKEKGYEKGYKNGSAAGEAMFETAIRIMDENAKQVELLNEKVREVNDAWKKVAKEKEKIEEFYKDL